MSVHVLAEGSRKKYQIAQNFGEKTFLIFSLLYHFSETSLLINNYYNSIVIPLYGMEIIFLSINNKLFNTGNLNLKSLLTCK